MDKRVSCSRSKTAGLFDVKELSTGEVTQMSDLTLSNVKFTTSFDRYDGRGCSTDAIYRGEVEGTLIDESKFNVTNTDNSVKFERYYGEWRMEQGNEEEVLDAPFLHLENGSIATICEVTEKQVDTYTVVKEKKEEVKVSVAETV